MKTAPLTLEQIELGERLHKEAADAHYIDERRMASHNLATYAYANLPQLLASARRELEREDERPIDETWLRSIGFDGPHFDDPERLSLTRGKIRVTHYISTWTAWMADGPAGPVTAYMRLRDDMTTRGQLLSLLHGLGIGEETR